MKVGKRNPSSGIKSRDFESVFLAYVSQRGPVALQANLRNDNTDRFKSRVTYLMGLVFNNANIPSMQTTPRDLFRQMHILYQQTLILPEEHEQFEAGYTFKRFSNL